MFCTCNQCSVYVDGCIIFVRALSAWDGRARSPHACRKFNAVDMKMGEPTFKRMLSVVAHIDHAWRHFNILKCRWVSPLSNSHQIPNQPKPNSHACSTLLFAYKGTLHVSKQWHACSASIAKLNSHPISTKFPPNFHKVPTQFPHSSHPNPRGHCNICACNILHTCAVNCNQCACWCLHFLFLQCMQNSVFALRSCLF